MKSTVATNASAAAAAAIHVSLGFTAAIRVSSGFRLLCYRNRELEKRVATSFHE